MQNCNCDIKKNMGLADRIILTAASAVLIELVTCKKVPASIRGGLLIVSGVFLATSFMGSCPLYSALDISTVTNGDKYEEHMPKRVF